MDIFINSKSNLLTKNKTYKLIIIFLIALLLYKEKTMSKLIDNQETIIVPSGLSESVRVKRNKLSPEYLKEMARYVIDLYGNISSGNVDYKYTELLNLVDSKSYSNMREKLMARSDLLKRFPTISYSVNIIESKSITLNKNFFNVMVSKSEIIGREIGTPNSSSYDIYYKVINGRFWLTDIKEIKK